MTVPKRTTRTPPDPELLKLADHLLANYRKPDDSHRAGFARGGDDKIISLYARGLTVREIQSHLEEIYGAEVSPSLISAVTDAVSEEVKVW